MSARNPSPEDQSDSLTLIPFPEPELDAPAGLPTQLTSFIDREREVEELAGLLKQPEVRILTLTGPGGVGKTRLALRAAAETGAEVTFISLASIEDSSLVALTIGRAFGFTGSSDRLLPSRLAAALSGRKRLLLLDNFEPVVEAAPLLAQLAATCPTLTILVTSRVVLRISGEREFRVPPLALPVPDSPEGTIEAAPSVRLFFERSFLEQDEPQRPLSSADVVAAAAICRRLDGLPLAIELAAARTRLLSPSELLTRLDPRLPLLTEGPRDAPVRLRTMRDAIFWSYELLSDDEQALFRGLSVFAGGFTVDSAEAVAGPATAGPDSTQAIVDGLVSLMEQSLIRRDEHPASQGRFTMLETIREFGLERLVADDEIEAARGRHVAWLAGLVGEPEFEAWDGHWGIATPSLTHEQDNLRSAIGWSLDQGEPELAIRLVAGLAPFWWEQGLYAEASSTLDRILEQGGSLDPAVRSVLMVWATEWSWLQSDYPRARDLATSALHLSRNIDHRTGIAASLFQLGRVAIRLDPQSAPAILEEGLSVSRELENDRAVVWSLLGLGRALISVGDLAGAGICYAEAKDRIDQLDPTRRGRLPLTWAQSMAQVSLLQGKLDLSQDMLENSLATSRVERNKLGEVTALLLLGKIALDRRDLGAAATRTRDALQLAIASGALYRESYCLAQLAAIAAAIEQFHLAARLLGAEAAVREPLLLVNSPDERELRMQAHEPALEALGDREFNEAWATGRSLTTVEVLNEAAALVSIAPAQTWVGAGLTRREIEILRGIAANKTNRQIAEDLFLSRRTVEVHVGSIIKKLGGDSRQAAVAAARERGLLGAHPGDPA